MNNHKSVNAFIFSVFMVTLTAMFFFLFEDPSLYTDEVRLRKLATSFLLLGSMGIFFIGLFYDNDWVQSAQLIIIIMLTVFISKTTNVLIGLSAGTITFGILTFGYRVSFSSSISNTTSYLWLGVKWVFVSVLGTVLSKIVDGVVSF